MTALAFKLDSKPACLGKISRSTARIFPGAGLAWLDARRRAAMDAFAKTGVPTRRVEAWKYTDLANAMESDLAVAARVHGPVPDENLFGGIAGARLVLVHGYLERVAGADGLEIVDLGTLDARTPEWVKTHLGAMAASGEQPMGAASLALMRGGVAVRVTRAHRRCI